MRLLPIGAVLLTVLLSTNPATSQTARDPVTVPAFDLQGHRGARGLAPENTIPAFLAAIEIGVTTLELDVVISADSVVVVSHEPWMSSDICTQPSGEPVPAGSRDDFNMYRMTYEEIRSFDCGSMRHPRFPRQEPTPAVKPKLVDVIAAAEAWTDERGLPPQFYNIETKSRPESDNEFHPEPATFVRLLIEAIDAGGIRDRAIIQSFDVRTLQVATRVAPDLDLALLIASELDDGFDQNLESLGFEPEIYSPHYPLVTADLIAAARERGIRVIPWTVNEWEEMQRLKEMGVDGLITDYPDVGVKLLD